MTAHKYYKRGLVTAEQFDGSAEMAERWGLLSDGPRWYTGDTIMDFLVKRGMWIIGKPSRYPSQQIINDADFYRLYAPLPVIPQAVGEFIETAKSTKMNLYQAMQYIQNPLNKYCEWAAENNPDTFALAWLLGEWEVENG